MFPFLNQFMMLTYHGNFFGLLNPFGILAGLVSLFMLLTQGTTWLMMKTDGEVLARSPHCRHDLLTGDPGAFAAAGWWVSGMEGYVIVQRPPATDAVSNPMKQGSCPAGWRLDEQLHPLSVDGGNPVLGLAVGQPADCAVCPR